VLRSPERGHLGRVTIDGRPPAELACLLLGEDDLLIVTGTDQRLARSALRRPVSVEFHHLDRATGEEWTVLGMGLGTPLTPQDHRRRLPRTTVTAASQVLEHGFHLAVARYTGTVRSKGTLPNAV
jgi:hypothetical protein